MNKFGRFLGKIFAVTCLKIDYFGSKSPKLPSAGVDLSDSLAPGSWSLRFQTSVQVK